MNKQGPLNIQTAIFEDYLSRSTYGFCKTRNIQKIDFFKLRLRQNFVNFHTLAKPFETF